MKKIHESPKGNSKIEVTPQAANRVDERPESPSLYDQLPESTKQIWSKMDDLDSWVSRTVAVLEIFGEKAFQAATESENELEIKISNGLNHLGWDCIDSLRKIEGELGEMVSAIRSEQEEMIKQGIVFAKGGAK